MIWTKHAWFGWTLSTYVSQLFIAISLARKSHNNTNASRECEYSLFWSCTSSLNVLGALAVRSNQQRNFYGLEYIQKLTGACIACVAECGLRYGLSHTHISAISDLLKDKKNFLCFQPNGVWYGKSLLFPSIEEAERNISFALLLSAFIIIIIGFACYVKQRKAWACELIIWNLKDKQLHCHRIRCRFKISRWR